MNIHHHDHLCFHPFPLFGYIFFILSFSSGGLEDGSTSSSTTNFQLSMGGSSSFTPKTPTSSGPLCWRKPTPSLDQCDLAIFCGGGGAGLLTSPVCCRVCGSYADMNAGTPAEALVDFTGGVHICVQLSDPPSNLWELMCRAGEASSLMGCGTDGVKKHSAHETSMLKHVKRTKV